jgi:hypothetical protein
MDYLEQSPSWEANSHSASQEIASFSCNPMVHCCVYKKRSMVPILSQITIYPISRRSILILCSLLCLNLPSGVFLSGFQTKMLYAFVICTTCPINLNLLDLIILISEEECNFEASYCATSCHFCLLRSKHSPQHSVSKHP